jgi:phage RecT family recombinase
MNESAIMEQIASAETDFNAIVSAEKLPLHFARESEFARNIIMASEQLMKCDPTSIKNALVSVASLGLTLNPIKQHAALIHRWNKKKQITECSPMVMYRGLMYLAGQAGVQQIEADVVYDKDYFHFERSEAGVKYRHVISVKAPRGTDDNKFVGSYVAALMPGQTSPKVEWVPAEDIYEMREQSDSYRDDNNNVRPGSPWVRWFDEQAKKSAIKRVQKRWEDGTDYSAQWERLAKAVDLDNKLERRDDFIEGTATEGTDKKPAEPIKAPANLTPDLISVIEQMAGSASLPIATLLSAYKVETLAEVPASKFEEIKTRIEAYLRIKMDKLAKQTEKENKQKAAEQEKRDKDNKKARAR